MLVIIESPFQNNPMYIEYARLALKDSLQKNEYPLASHLLYPQVLDDTNPKERAWGINAGLEWAKHASKTIVYTDFGITPGMEQGIQHAISHYRPVEYRKIEFLAKTLAQSYNIKI